MDLSRKTGLTADENLEVSSELHVLLLGGIARAEAWGTHDAVLHGGGGVRFRHGSRRWSEDLDFMVEAGRFDRLERMASGVVEGVRRASAALWPGCDIALRTRTRQDAVDALHVWDVRWSHPARQGKVTVKVEFYRTTRELLRSYGSDLVAVMNASGRTRVSGQVPVADALSLWGDKIKALATRPAAKLRDVHDLGYLRGVLERAGGVGDAERLAAIELSCRVYGRTLEDVLPLLRGRIAEGVLEDREGYMADMRRWFPGGPSGDDAVAMAEGFLEGARAEVLRAAMIMEAELARRAAPAIPAAGVPA